MVGTSSGTKLKKLAPSSGGGSDVTIAHLTSISGISASAETIDITALDSTGGYREFLASFKDGGEVSVSGFFDHEDAGQQALIAAFNDETKDSYAIEFPESVDAKWTFDAVVSAIETSAEVGNAVAFSATLKVSGKPILAALSDSSDSDT